jgi:predicted alpha/beta-hydrolase family hydrolase
MTMGGSEKRIPFHGRFVRDPMPIRVERLAIDVGQDEKTSGLFLTRNGNTNKTGIIVAHGAANSMSSPLVSAFSEGVAQAGFPTLKFNFLYSEHGKQHPDREEVLVKAWLAAYRFFAGRSDLGITSIVGAGKSLGGRIAAQMTADGILSVKRLVFLGYPLHPAGDPEKLRADHLYRIRVPMLFFAGTRDSLCNLDKLKSVLGRLHTDWELSVVEGGDHSFNVPKAMKIDETEVMRKIVEKTVEWLRE